MTLHAVLIGLPGTGKSTAARRLAKIMAVPCADSDELVERAQGRPIRAIFEQDGEDAFRELEADAVAAALRERSGVLALGGGAVLTARTRDAIAAAGVPVVLLRAGLDTLVSRLGGADTRPLLVGQPRERLAELARQRDAVYAAVATVVVDTDNRTPGQVAATVAAKLHELTRVHG